MEQQDHLESRTKIRLHLWGAFMVYLTYRLLNNLERYNQIWCIGPRSSGDPVFI